MAIPWTRYVNDVQELFSQRLVNHPSLVLWRAYGPTHFGGPTGTYTGAHAPLVWLSPLPWCLDAFQITRDVRPRKDGLEHACACVGDPEWCSQKVDLESIFLTFTDYM